MEPHPGEPGRAVIERAVLSDSAAGREIAAAFVRDFGEFVSTSVRPILVEVAASGGEPQLLMNGLAELLRATADSIEFPLSHPRAGSPHGAAGFPAGDAADDVTGAPGDDGDRSPRD